MKISVNSLWQYQQRYQWSADPAPDGVQSLAERIGAQLGAIEEVIDFGSAFNGVVVVRVVSCEKHPDADKLNVCKIDDGGKTTDVARDDNGLVQVVCGAPNVRAGLTVAWLPPGSTVPESVGKDPFVLGARELRGVMSNGMLASPRELTLSDNHEGILEIDGDIEPGTPFVDAFNLRDDVIFDIENKMFTHRPDCFGSMGVAREIAGIQQQAFTSPDWYRSDADIPAIEAEELPVSVQNDIPELVPRFCAVALRDVTIKPSPVWLQIELVRAGLRPINNIVDLTNYYMLLTGQPLHAYDYDKLKAIDDAPDVQFVIRHPKDGEKIKLINGKELEPRAEAMMIASRKSLIGIGGVMGGFDSEVDENTKNIVLEAANFDMYSIRRTSMAHGLFTDAVTRFNKGQSPLQNRAVMGRIVADIRELAGGKVASLLVDDSHLSTEVLARNSLHAPVTVSAQFINERLGLSLTAAEMADLLRNVEFDVAISDESLTAQAPFWRTDIEIPEDVVEEVGRLYGFDHLPLVLPQRSLSPAPKEPMVELKAAIRKYLSQAGANELLTYSFVHGKLLEQVGQDVDQAFGLSNALSPSLQYYRLSILPSLLDKVHANMKAGYGHFALFELGKTHQKGQFESDEPEIPKESHTVALVVAADDKHVQAGAPYYQAKRYLESLFGAMGASIRIAPVSGTPESQLARPFDASRSAYVFLGDSQLPLGVVGEFTSSVRKSLKLPAYSAGFEIAITPEMRVQASRYRSQSKYPKVEQDICLKVAAETTYQQVFEVVSSQVAALVPEHSYYTLSPLDMYQRQDETDHKQITLRLSVTSYDKTLRDSEVASILDQVSQAAGNALRAERV